MTLPNVGNFEFSLPDAFTSILNSYSSALPEMIGTKLEVMRDVPQRERKAFDLYSQGKEMELDLAWEGEERRKREEKLARQREIQARREQGRKDVEAEQEKRRSEYTLFGGVPRVADAGVAGLPGAGSRPGYTALPGFHPQQSGPGDLAKTLLSRL